MIPSVKKVTVEDNDVDTFYNDISRLSQVLHETPEHQAVFQENR